MYYLKKTEKESEAIMEGAKSRMALWILTCFFIDTWRAVGTSGVYVLFWARQEDACGDGDCHRDVYWIWAPWQRNWRMV